MAEITIRLMDNGPLQVSGVVELVDADGGRFETKDPYHLCRCGLTRKRPFCDGSHKAGGFTDQTRAK